MYGIIDQIRYDHISISRVLHVMDQELNRIKTDDNPDFDLLVECMRYMVNYVDVVHHPKEDVMMECVSQKTDELKDIIEEIEMQHRSIGDMSKDFYSKVEKAAAGEFISRDTLIKSGTGYIKAQRKHVNLEEGSLLRKVRHLLNEEDVEKINQQYAQFRDPQLSDTFEQEYNKLYQSLLH